MILICFVSIIVCCVLLQIMRYREGFEGLYLSQKSRCFDCERALPDGLKWLGQPTKDFSSQFQLAAQNPYGGYFAAPEKCFSCQGQLTNLRTVPQPSGNAIDSGWRFPGSYVL